MLKKNKKKEIKMRKKSSVKKHSKKEVPNTPSVELPVEVTSTQVEKATAAQLALKLSAFLKDEGATGFVFGIVGGDGRIVPFVGASSIGELLSIQYIIDKEITRLIDGTSATKEASGATTQQ